MARQTTRGGEIDQTNTRSLGDLTRTSRGSWPAIVSVRAAPFPANLRLPAKGSGTDNGIYGRIFIWDCEELGRANHGGYRPINGETGNTYQFLVA